MSDIVNLPDHFSGRATAGRTFIIQRLIDVIGARSYLEIGLGDGMHFGRIRCQEKCSVDPAIGDTEASTATNRMTSDEFFRVNRAKFDLIFIDGLHHAEAVRADISNSLEILNPGGIIVCHDMNPTTEEMQRVPREQIEWTGDCWRAWLGLRRERGDLQMFVVDADYGVGVIIPDGEPKTPRLILEAGEITFQDFAEHRARWLPTMPVEEFYATMGTGDPGRPAAPHPAEAAAIRQWSAPRPVEGDRPFLVYCPTNGGDHVAELLCEQRLFDVALNDYSGRGEGTGGAEWRFAEAGHKWPCIAKNLPRIDRGYEMYAFLDNDIEITAQALDSLFLIGNSLDLDLFQAALTPDSTCSYPDLKQVAGSYAREGGFVEVMMPVFSRRGLGRCAHTFGDSESGWGLDVVWPRYLDGCRIGIVDAIVARHPGPVNSQLWELSHGMTAEEEMSAVIARHARPD